MDTNCCVDDNNIDTLFDLLCNEILENIISYSDLSIIDRFNVIKVSKRSHDWINDFVSDLAVINRKTLMRSSHQMICASDLALIISKCVNVQHIDLTHIRVCDHTIIWKNESGVAIMSAIAQNCNRLKSIYFGLLDVNNDELAAIASNCSQIKRISSQTISDATLRHIIASPNLESLDISGNTKITGHVLKNIGPNVTELNLNAIQINLIPLIRRLKVQEISEYYSNNRLLKYLIPKRHDKLIHIRKLSVRLTSSDELWNICCYFRCLKHIGLNVTCDRFDFGPLKEVRALTSVSINAKHFHQCLYVLYLRVLELEVTRESYSRYSTSIKFRDSSLTHLTWCAPHLRKLVLRQFHSISCWGLLSIAALTSLVHLDLMNCENVFNEGVLRVINACHGLRVLNVHNCVGIGPQVLQAIVLRCDSLHSHEIITLDVVNTGITNVQSIVTELPSNLNLLVNIDQCVYDCWHDY